MAKKKKKKKLGRPPEWKRKEKQEHRDAFEMWYLLGNDTPTDVRAEILAEEFNRARSTIYEWKRRYHWDERSEERDLKIHEKVERRTNQTITDNKVRYLELVHKSIEKYEDDIKNGLIPVEIKKSTDLDRVIKLALLIQGEDGTGTRPDQPLEKTTKEKAEEYERFFTTVDRQRDAYTKTKKGDSHGDTGQPANSTQPVLETDTVPTP